MLPVGRDDARDLKGGSYPKKLSLKKSNLDLAEPRNYKPVSNISFLGKVLVHIGKTIPRF